MHTSPAPLFDADLAAVMQRGISLNVGSCGPDLLPSGARAVGCRVSADRRTVRILVSARQAAAVIAHVQASAALAAVFSEPSTHRTIQLKGHDARLEEPSAQDIAADERKAGVRIEKTGRGRFRLCADRPLQLAGA